MATRRVLPLGTASAAFPACPGAATAAADQRQPDGVIVDGVNLRQGESRQAGHRGRLSRTS